MTLETALSLIGFAFVMSISPGPANILLLISGANFGYKKTLPMVLGISGGFLTMVFFIGIGFGQFIVNHPFIYSALRTVCFSYVLWLAFQIARSRSLGSEDGDEMSKPFSFTQAALFQLVNPKAWAVALILNVSYTSAENFIPSLLLLLLIFAVVNIPSISVWALSGAAFRQSLSKGNRITIFNTGMALLLVGAMGSLLLKS
ncbi:LysE family translocator [Maridesulfovibrio sp.]|uniref:LysE family translocator n=1 Tax=Maridesulfovibrio sp. TaxID=2795000 RepID=UPI002A189EAD|nr:LysE family translocator [Maridesulfovibrio sp.]